MMQQHERGSQGGVAKPSRFRALQPWRAFLVMAAVFTAFVPWDLVFEGTAMPQLAALVIVMAVGGAAARLIAGAAASPIGALCAGIFIWCNLAVPDDVAFGWLPVPRTFDAAIDVINVGVGEVLYSSGNSLSVSPGMLAVTLAIAVILGVTIDAVVFSARMPAVGSLLMVPPLILPLAYFVEVQFLDLVPGLVVAALLLVHRVRVVRVIDTSRRALAAGLAVAIALTAAIAVPVFADVPGGASVTWAPWQVQAQAENGGPAAGGDVVLSTSIDLLADLQRPSPSEILTYSTSDGAGTYLRLTTLQEVAQSGFVTEPGEAVDSRESLGGFGPGTPLETTVTVGQAAMGNLPVPPMPISVTSESDQLANFVWDATLDSFRFENADAVGDLAGAAMTISSIRPAPFPETGELTSTEHSALTYLLPGVRETGLAFLDEIAAPLSSPADTARAIYAAMTDDSWVYSENVPYEQFGSTRAGGWDAVADFLEVREGYCVHYATATVMIARAAGIPARVAVGFLPGAPNGDGSFTVTTNDVHAWAELWFDGLGWVAFDTTPGADSGQAVSAPDEEPSGATPTEEPADPAPSATPTPTPTSSDEAVPAEPVSSEQPGTSAPSAAAPLPLHLLWWLFVFVAAVPALVRWRLRTRRLRGGAVQAWSEVLATSCDLGGSSPPAATTREAADLIVASWTRLDAVHDVRELASRAEREMFSANLDDALASDTVDRAARVCRELRLQSPLWRRALATVLPLSLVVPKSRW